MLLLLAIAVPLAGAGLAALLPLRLRPAVGLSTAGLTAAVTVALAAQVLRDGPAALTSPDLAGLVVTLAVDGLAATLLLMAGVVGLATTAFAVVDGRLEGGGQHRAYWPLWLLLWAGMHALFLAGDLFLLYLMLELIAVAGAALVILGGGADRLRAGTRYFFAEFAASATFLLGVALVWRAGGTVVLTELPAELAASPTGMAGLAVMTIGLLLKLPLFPLHFWLPAAHAVAPSAVSPVLSGVVVKTAFAVLIRLWYLAMPEAVLPSAALVLGVLGTLAIVWGSLRALRVAEVKLLIAHSTVAQLGFMILLVPLLTGGALDAWRGGVVFAVAHAIAKAAALMAATVLVRAAPGSAVADLGGSAARRPLATFAFGVASISLVGLPPSGGFVAKWYLLLASFETGQWWWAVVIVGGSLLTAAYLMRVVKRSFAPPPDDAPVLVERDPREVVALLLALLAFGIGLRPTELLALIEVGAPLVGLGGR